MLGSKMLRNISEKNIFFVILGAVFNFKDCFGDNDRLLGNKEISA